MRRMRSFAIRVVINAVALWVATEIVSGVSLEQDTTAKKVLSLLIVAVIFGLINAFIKPVVKLIALPLFILTLGLITFVINAAMLSLLSWISGKTDLGFHVDDFFWSAIFGALVVSVVSWLLSVILPDPGE
jgi:putative membrane protein